MLVEGTITGSVVHFHWIRNVDVQYSGVISVSGLGTLISSKSYPLTEFHTSLNGFHCSNDALLYSYFDHLQDVLVGWVEEGILKMVLVVEAGMEDMVAMDIIMEISLRVVLHMGMLICHVNLVVAVEIIA